MEANTIVVMPFRAGTGHLQETIAERDNRPLAAELSSASARGKTCCLLQASWLHRIKATTMHRSAASAATRPRSR